MGNCVAAEGENKAEIMQTAIDTGIFDSVLKKKENVQTLILRISAAELQNKKDIFCVVWQLKGNKGMRKLAGKTEIIEDCTDPQFVKGIEVDYRFEENQKFMIEIYEAVDKDQTENLSMQDLIGSNMFLLHSVVSARHSILRLELKSPVSTNCGKIQIESQLKKADYGRKQCSFELQSTHTDDSYMFLTIGKPSKQKGKFILVYKTECKKNPAINKWNKVVIDSDTLANDDPKTKLQVNQYLFKESGQHEMVRTWNLTYSQLIESSESNSLTLDDDDAQLEFKNVTIEHRTRLIDFINGGFEIGFQVAIDFTKSNLEPDKFPMSLHCPDPNINEYQRTIRSIGPILEYYDNDKKFPIFGFGGRVDGERNDCFALNGNDASPECDGVECLINCYKQAVKTYQLGSPTHFHPLLNRVNADCASMQNSKKYTILLIITDGAVWEEEKTIDEIVLSSDLPLSIIIVGVGKESDFGFMESLDADTKPLYSETHKKYQSRDNIQFVPFRQYASNTEKMCKEVLAEIPQQMLMYYKYRNIGP